MAPPVYTEQVASFFLTLGENVSFTVPPGVRWIVHDVTGRLVNDTDPFTFGLIWATAVNDLYAWQAPAYSRRPFHWRGQQAFNPGNELVFSCPGPSGGGPVASGQVTAAVLSLP
jgi:hypothetical protein